jgi:hypothetical protein
VIHSLGWLRMCCRLRIQTYEVRQSCAASATRIHVSQYLFVLTLPASAIVRLDADAGYDQSLHTIAL